MDWKQLLVYITGSVEENLLLRIAYLVAENRILRDQIKGRVQLSDTERRTLAEIGKKLGKQALEEYRMPLPPRSPNLNAYAERWVRSVKEEVLSKLILFGECALRHALNHYTSHFHEERPHQGIGNVIPFPTSQPANEREGILQCHERLGGLLKYYEPRAA